VADNFTANPGSGGSAFASDDVGGVHYPRIKRSFGRDGTAADAGSVHRLVSAASTNATNVKASPGVVYAIVAINLNAAVRYLKLYNKATAPTVGTDTPVATIPIPASTTGAGVVIPIPSGWDFSSGISEALTTGAGDADTGAVAANEIFVHLVYV
jgi:hypothetical protein